MPALSSITDPPKIILWGPPRCGKTAFICSYGEGLQFIDLDHGRQTCVSLKDKWYGDRQKCDYITDIFTTDASRADVWPSLKQRIIDIGAQCRAKTYPYKVLAIDSMTTASDECLRYVQLNSGTLNKIATPKNPLMTEPMWVSQSKRSKTFSPTSMLSQSQ